MPKSSVLAGELIDPSANVGVQEVSGEDIPLLEARLFKFGNPSTRVFLQLASGSLMHSLLVTESVVCRRLSALATKASCESPPHELSVRIRSQINSCLVALLSVPHFPSAPGATPLRYAEGPSGTPTTQDSWTPRAASALSPWAVSADASVLAGVTYVKLAPLTAAVIFRISTCRW